MSAAAGGRALNVTHLDLRRLNSLQDFDLAARRAAEVGSNCICLGPLFDLAQPSDPLLVADHSRSLESWAQVGSPVQVVEQLARRSDRQGLSLFVDIVLDRVACNGASAQGLTGIYHQFPGLNPLDPRHTRRDVLSAVLREGAESRAAEWWAMHLAALVSSGARGFRLLGVADLPRQALRPIVNAVRAKTACDLWGWTPGLDWARHRELADAGLSAVFASTCWWDGRAGWLVEEYEALRRIAPVLGVVAPPYEAVSLTAERLTRNLMLAAAASHGVFMPGGVEEPCQTRRAHALADKLACKRVTGELRALSAPDAAVAMFVRTDRDDARQASCGVAIAVNTQSTPAEVSLGLEPLPPMAGLGLVAIETEGPLAPRLLQPGEVLVVEVAPTEPVRASRRNDKRDAKLAAARSPVAIERVSPVVAGAGFAAKHIVGRPLTIEVDILADGHDVLAAELTWWSADKQDRSIVPLRLVGNDRWLATVTPGRIGRHHFSIEAWRDEYASLCHAMEVKHRAGVDIAVELSEADAFLQSLGDIDPAITALAAAARSGAADTAVAELTSLKARTRVAAVAERHLPAYEGPFAVEVERPQAEFAAWYELFPRSITDSAGRHGTFDDVIATLPRVREMGFDVLYFPPIHPIGHTNRKGRNNSLSAGPDDPGSPYAIGSEGGGHDAIHTALGTPQDFRRLVAAAHDHGLEIALDFAIQCSLDHPWLREHPEWFRHRPDGSIKYAENPPKKYEDIVNVDFYADGAIPALWLALRDVVLHWVGEGVRIFRVDNPHTKPLPFWQWMIGDIRGRHPDVIFLSEAFTRPKMMYRLAKVGFSQSYTYFTWRNGKQEIIDYLRELTTTEVVDFFRPHFFVNTPDINPIFLQSSGRAGFLIRAALAATLSGLWGVYSGFELCEATALPGREEYLDSEKYEIRPRNFASPGNIVAEITLLNRLRRTYPALHSHRGVTFYNAFNDQVLVYGKREPGADDMILVAVSLDPHGPQHANFELPLWEWKLPDDGVLQVEDLVRDARFAWQGKMQSVSLNPATLPFAIWRLSSRRAA
ncbi:alpha-1,4-glucan--maltose-1-phosphate maltosyltransferase [Reyranella sp.]|uniref:alpha-1,4-glucan--maltose-1-phosphate maltosyltransferase n=1 Tax=Reyranella sp. TaxID=1929291 RepID=UPI0025FC01C1|nr:alpha-1,4-glucan--maltose-1-phosphate maltosyltransferase [Reyranella sp.]